MRQPEQFEEAILDVLQQRWEVPTYLELFNRTHMNQEGARVYALEHCVFGANFPRWLANITGNCPHLAARKYLIENMYVEEVEDPTIAANHYESLVDFAVALGLDRDFVLAYQGAPITRMRMAYCDWVSRQRPWLEAFAAVASGEMSRGTRMIARVGEKANLSRRTWDALKLDDKALAHWDAADEADSHEGGHGDVPFDILMTYADTAAQQDACLAAMAEFIAVTRLWSDQIGVWAFEVSGLEPPPLTGRQPRPVPKFALTA
ncbi:MAG: iron-containing redox enzyme family protein [Alphaproteobacteria bacterium]|nr:iron-containing redox enzyme family protein [Alphaproteobacteria bacterium]